MQDVDAILSGWYVGERGGEALFTMLANAGPHEAACLPPELGTVRSIVVRHEVALVAFAELELAGEVAVSMCPIEAFLSSVA
jgi:hypothetical protein